MHWLKRGLSRPVRVLMGGCCCTLLVSACVRQPLLNWMLTKAVERQEYAHAKRLLSAGADPQTETGNLFQETCAPLLFTAILQHDTPMVRLLLEHGENVNTEDMWGHSALEISVGTGNIGIVQELIAHGADMRGGFEEENHSLTLAKQKKYNDIVRLLQQAGAKEYP